MLSRILAEPLETRLRLLDPVELFRLCAAERENSEAWSEFLRRYASKIKYFIGGALRQVSGYSPQQNASIASGGVQGSDLFQNAIVRLVENNCAAMKRFSGASENELLAYLAVICRSTVLDTLRRNNALKRRAKAFETEESITDFVLSHTPENRPESEREILIHELVSLTQQAIKSYSGHVSHRDQLVFKLHFFDGLSFSQISQCSGINLSKAGVEKMLKRLLLRVQTLASAGKSEETLQ